MATKKKVPATRGKSAKKAAPAANPPRSHAAALPVARRPESSAVEPSALVSGFQRQNRGADSAGFPVVAIGASAGGLAALQQFFDNVPKDSGMPYVVITHQAPHKATLLPELLGKHAKNPVRIAADGMKLEPNVVYVAPPGGPVTIRNETLFVDHDAATRGLNLSIDHTFRSLAQNEGERAIAIVLSGNGSDGTHGIAEVKGAFGMVMAQDPQTAQYPGMPSSAIATQLVDYVLDPAQMPAQLMRYVRGQRETVLTPIATKFDHAAIEGAMQKMLAILRNRTGSDFSAYKKSTIGRRIERRMHVHGISDPVDYVHFLEHTAFEVDALFKELLISVTRFFRDPEAFEVLDHELAKLIDSRSGGDTLRIWVPGCATGEEAYSIAMLGKEVIQRSGRTLQLQIFATDLDQHAIDVARAGRYPDGIAADVSPDRLSGFFTREDDCYRVNKDVRESIVFAVQNVIRDPPFTKLDLLSCRNLLIYLESHLQKRVLGLFTYSLRPGGLLMLGTSESVTGFDDQFLTLDKRWKLFQRLPNSAVQRLPDLVAERAVHGSGPGHPLARDGHRGPPGIGSLAEKLLLSTFVPPGIIVSERGELIYVHGRIGMYFEPPSGEPTQNVFNMAREGLRAELPSAVRQAASSQGMVIRRGLQVKTNGGYTSVSICVRRLSEPDALRGAFVITFETDREKEPLARKRGKTSQKSFDRVAALEEELQRTRENLQGMIEELETSNEELKSTNEELQSTNEELQSTNEELETSREEMQSLNEELQTVNAELEDRNRALSQANDDMQNLLNSTDVATVFLDDKLRVKRFTTQAKEVFRLIESDIGRPISDLAANLRYDSLVEDARQVLSTLVFVEREVQTTDGGWRLMRILPYRTHENLIDGLVLTFVDIDRLKQAQRAEKETRAYGEGLFDTMSAALLVLDHDLRVISANRAFYEMFGDEAKRVIGARFNEIARDTFGKPEISSRVLAALSDDEPFVGLPLKLDGKRTLALSARAIPETQGPRHVLLTIEVVPEA